MNWMKFRCYGRRLFGSAAVLVFAAGLLMVICKCDCLAQASAQKTFPSAEDASQALYDAVAGGNEQVVMQVLGGGKELLSSDDDELDKLDRERFAQKYQQMHRLVRASDGTELLYIGAENWPFPIPLASKEGLWYFDSEKGKAEIRFRRIGENEATALETCRDLIQLQKANPSATGSDDPVLQYARALLASRRENSGGDAASQSSAKTPFYGYYFRIIPAPVGTGTASAAAAHRFVSIAYPAEYRSSGVLTFVVSPGGAVYQADLGMDTAKIAEDMTGWKPAPSWRLAR